MSVADANDGVYSAQAHTKSFSADRAEFVTRHLRRLSALAKHGFVAENAPGEYQIPANYLDMVGPADLQIKGPEVAVRVLDSRSLDAQTAHRGMTWLDDHLPGWKAPGEGEFGASVLAALQLRLSNLRTMGLVPNPLTALTRSDRATLLRIEVEDLFKDLGQSGQAVSFAREGERFVGVYEKRLSLGSETFAVIREAG
ncbi:hypothetical protein LTR94_030082, partial [Friedmanniomyces endolithicus]